jgi:hypothetical protein
VSSASDGSCGGGFLWAGRSELLLALWSLIRDVALLCRMWARGGMDDACGGMDWCCCWLFDSEKAVTPARRAISCSPICQCMASAARHGKVISSAILAHMSALNLKESELVLLLYKI